MKAIKDNISGAIRAMKVKGKICLILLPAAAVTSCSDLRFYEYADRQPDMEAINADPAISIRAAQSPDNVWNVSFTYGESISEENDIYIHANKPVENNFSVDLGSAGEEFVAGYSEKTGTDYELLPQAFYRFSGGDYIDVQKGIQDSEPNTLTIYARNLLGNVLEPGRYLLPLKAVSATEEMKDSIIIVDVTVRDKWTDPDGYELYCGDDMFTVFYVNTSQFDPRLANDMIIYDSFESQGDNTRKGLGNIVNLRTASVDYDSATGKISVQPSSDLRYVLEHSTERVRPVQESGRKVCVCIEGGGKGIGFCNFSVSQIAEFTASVKRMVDTYGLDGVNLWDRNTGYDKAAENGFPEMNTTSYPKLIKALREALGSHRLITLTDYEEPTEYFWDTDATGGIQPGQYLDYAWSGYCSESEPVQIVDPWHQGQPNVSTLHPRKPVAGLDASRYGCVHATWYTDYTYAATESITEWVKAGLNQNGISVYYDIRSQVQDRYESGSCWNPSYILQAWFDNIGLSIDYERINNQEGFPGYNGNQYNKWAKDW